MSWEDVDDNKATPKQLEYATSLLEAVHGEIIKPIHKMTKSQISKLISELLQDVEDRGIDITPFMSDKWRR